MKLWRISSKCESHNCVEVALDENGTDVRDTKDRDGGTLSFTLQSWTNFIGAIQNGKLQ